MPGFGRTWRKWIRSRPGPSPFSQASPSCDRSSRWGCGPRSGRAPPGSRWSHSRSPRPGTGTSHPRQEAWPAASSRSAGGCDA